MYYPKSEILSVEYTSGDQLVVKTSKKSYVGYYYLTNDGRYFSGKEYGADTVELVKPYNIAVVQRKSQAYNFFYSEPTQKDYDRGSYTRFVIKRVNSGLETILEVSQQEFDRASKDPLYNTKSFTWKLTGPLYTTPEGIPGIVDVNQKTLDEVEKTIKDVKKYFTNLAQYAK